MHTALGFSSRFSLGSGADWPFGRSKAPCGAAVGVRRAQLIQLIHDADLQIFVSSSFSSSPSFFWGVLRVVFLCFRSLEWFCFGFYVVPLALARSRLGGSQG